MKKFINMQYVKMKRMASVFALLMLAFSLSLSAYPYISFRLPTFMWGFSTTYFVIPLLFIGIILLIWVLSHIYVRKFEMYKTESLAERVLNPYAVYLFDPFQEMVYRTLMLPTLKASYYSMPDGLEKQEVKRNLDLITKWLDIGYIPKKDFPEHLKQFYITDKEGRL